MALISSNNFIRILVAVALLVVLIFVGVGALWVGNLSLAGQPSFFERSSLPRTATVGNLVVGKPDGSIAATCRAVGGDAMAVYACIDRSCEVLRKVALASLSGAGAGAGRRVDLR